MGCAAWSIPAIDEESTVSSRSNSRINRSASLHIISFSGEPNTSGTLRNFVNPDAGEIFAARSASDLQYSGSWSFGFSSRMKAFEKNTQFLFMTL
jgi:hypothetical protein